MLKVDRIVGPWHPTGMGVLNEFYSRFKFFSFSRCNTVIDEHNFSPYLQFGIHQIKIFPCL